MKTIKLTIFSILGATLLGLGLYSCSNDDTTGVNELEKTNISKNANRKVGNSNLLSEQLLNLGIEKIEIIQNNDNEIITYHSRKSFYIDNNIVNINDFEFTYNYFDKKLTLNNNPEYYLVHDDNSYFINTPEKIINLKENNEFVLDKESSLLLLINSDILTEDINKYTYDNYSTKYPKPCGFFDQYEVVSLGFTKYQSQMNNYNATHGHNPLGAGCRKMGPPATSCLGDEHFCMTTQSFCCD